MSAISACGRSARPARDGRWSRRRPGAPPMPRVAWPVGSRPSWRAEALLSSQPVSRPSSTRSRGAGRRGPRRRTARERRPRRRCGSSTMVIAVGEDRLVLAAEQEAGPAGDRRAAHRAEQMADQAAADARIEHDRHRAAGQLARVEPLDRALAGEPAERLGLVEIGDSGGRCGWHSRAACRRPRRR